MKTITSLCTHSPHSPVPSRFDTMLAYDFELYNRPGLVWSEDRIRSMILSLRNFAICCLNPLPDYQCLTLSDPAALDDKLLVIARDPGTKEIVAFTSAVYYEVPDVGTVLHTGLTCVSPTTRRSGLTVYLFMHIFQYVVPRHPKGLWMTTLAEVPSSLVSVYQITTNVFPSPEITSPSPIHLRIASTLTSKYRHIIHAPPDAYLDTSKFLFRDSRPPNSALRTNPHDPALQHRNKLVNDFYLSLMNKDGGDDVLQVAFLDPTRACLVGMSRFSTLKSPNCLPGEISKFCKYSAFLMFLQLEIVLHKFGLERLCKYLRSYFL
ncbi:hypothetical protein SCHPADRAFT_945387 [Schizopora paradoxa]|uniref:Uncharacterized protein n=1 Tax=Schizopora paradoxa TaxID=27342 RepID=A0A0H2R7I1_9AGAM|nr:hypothetical protein SCHPADRAFT_945387 [Schizopora paradoxa]